MTDKTRIKIAAIVTALFLAGISTVGLASRSDKPTTVATPTSPAAIVQPRTAAPAAQLSAYADDGGDEGYENERDER